jgi:cell fate regulator YaaT (PSP1 superfamily)
MSALPDLLARPDAARQYIVSFGNSGGVGVFTADEPLVLQRGARVVIRSPRGVEVGAVRCRATIGQARLLGANASGALLRVLSSDDDARLSAQRLLSQRLFERSRQQAVERGLSLDILDAEILLDGQQAVLHFVGDEPQLDDFAQALERHFDLQIRFENLAQPVAHAEDEHDDEHGGCGKPDCGRTEGGAGGCTTCSTGGGCSSCGVKVDMRDYFGHLRDNMEKKTRRSLV